MFGLLLSPYQGGLTCGLHGSRGVAAIAAHVARMCNRKVMYRYVSVCICGAPVGRAHSTGRLLAALYSSGGMSVVTGGCQASNQAWMRSLCSPTPSLYVDGSMPLAVVSGLRSGGAAYCGGSRLGSWGVAYTDSACCRGRCCWVPTHVCVPQHVVCLRAANGRGHLNVRTEAVVYP